MRNILFLNFIVALLISSLNLNAEDTDFIGDWKNVDSNTGNITRFEITNGTSNGILKIHAYGACVPSDCDWGEVPLVLYSSSVTDKNYHYGTAVYKTDFSVTTITLELLKDKSIILDSYTQFTDNSKRYNYHSEDKYIKGIVKKGPDLIVNRIYRYSYNTRTRTLSVRAEIKNIGNEKAGKSIARLIEYANLQEYGAPYNEIALVNELNPNRSQTVSFTITYRSASVNTAFKLEVTADYKGMVVETNESNNVKTAP